ncbi:unnamed protein product [Linum trigynum]|uniref:Secreted protein n=1 Tax=Linum trigynum TaxID=586398 RepID=A0AAV2D971_9ROSI
MTKAVISAVGSGGGSVALTVTKIASPPMDGCSAVAFPETIAMDLLDPRLGCASHLSRAAWSSYWDVLHCSKFSTSLSMLACIRSQDA